MTSPGITSGNTLGLGCLKSAAFDLEVPVSTSFARSVFTYGIIVVYSVNIVEFLVMREPNRLQPRFNFQLAGHLWCVQTRGTTFRMAPA